ncbi:MAG: type III-B CRISPR module-associated Cmr3 family protein [Armatimonadota bacterium]|nr:type III-B CRISPR module-associated Cmr3 family protein [Armatimonadota bacterium]
MVLFIEAVDNWFFGDGRPFEAGEEHVAESLFPPLPRTVIGALRGKLLRAMGTDIGEYSGLKRDGQVPDALNDVVYAIGAPWETGPSDLSIRGPFIARWEPDGELVEPFFPLPADVLRDKDDGSCHLLRPLRPLASNVDVETSLPAPLHPLWLTNTGAFERPERASSLLTGADLQSVLGGHPPGQIVENQHLYSVKPRAGIALKADQKITRDGHLYEIGVVTPRVDTDAGSHAVVGLVIDVAGLDPSGYRNVIQLGGESRWAVLRNAVTVKWPEPPEHPLCRFSIYLASPVVLSHGWYPEWLECSSDVLSGDMPGIGKVRLISVALSGGVSVGGYNVAKGRSRGSSSAVPAGTVYFFEALEKITREKLGELHGSLFGDESPSDTPGMGLSFVGSWDYV